MTCKKAPRGWSCSREEGHEGPCAALPVGPVSRETFGLAMKCWVRQFEDGHAMRVPGPSAKQALAAINRHGIRIEETDLEIVFEMMHGPGHEIKDFFKRDWNPTTQQSVE